MQIQSPCLLPRYVAIRYNPPRYCQWCAARNTRKNMFKLRDGPIDWFFCDSDHALAWVEHRHKTVQLNRLLHLTPNERATVLGKRRFEQFVDQEVSKQKSDDA